MRSVSLLFLFAILASCTRSGLNSGSNVNPESTTSGDNSGDTTSTTGGSTGGISSLSMRYTYPNIPSDTGTKQFYVTSFADDNIDAVQQQLIGRDPARQIRVDGAGLSDGSGYCFSNEVTTDNAVNCAHPTAASDIVTEIKHNQTTATGRQALFISSIQMSFKKQAQTGSGATDYFSDPTFQGAYVEKALIEFDPATGLLKSVSDPSLDCSACTSTTSCKACKQSYGAGCALESSKWAVGFNNPSTYLGKEFYMTGMWSFERAKRKAFGETDDVRQAHICQNGASGGQWLCNLFADKISIWYAAIFPVLLETPDGARGVGSRQYPSQKPDDDGVIQGGKSAANTTFGIYAGQADGPTFLNTPAIGRNADNGTALPNWQMYFITKLCLQGYRRERDPGGAIVDRPLINALRVELRSPYSKITR